ncbi:MAG: hypothetical protein RI897_1802 [Verrucomicrobiota bacterium]
MGSGGDEAAVDEEADGQDREDDGVASSGFPDQRKNGCGCEEGEQHGLPPWADIMDERWGEDVLQRGQSAAGGGLDFGLGGQGEDPDGVGGVGFEAGLDDECFLVFLPAQEGTFLECVWCGVAVGAVQAGVQGSGPED